MEALDSTDTTITKIADPETTAKRTKSGIAFVYMDLEAVVGLVKTLHSHSGTSCEVLQLATLMNQSSKSGTFRATVAAAKSFGLLEALSPGRVSLTSLGQSVVDKPTYKSAIVEAFMRVPLHAAMYEKYSGRTLPPAAAIERQLTTLGVPSKQKGRARQTFTKSAKFAGFINPDNGRLAKPTAASGHMAPGPDSETQNDEKGGGGDGEGPDLDPLLMALLRKIPPVGKEWPQEPRARWFRTLR